MEAAGIEPASSARGGRFRGGTGFRREVGGRFGLR
jgi:hypothetical protein